ncbi:HEAT repeat domain-containing protein [Nocardia sp. NPDC052566]|uniref:HEAT repeat domain-containing protein n=1 Tax=Nocardia sp. NPDC052566 TaxID=3364330 RepID=UPI0037C9A34C
MTDADLELLRRSAADFDSTDLQTAAEYIYAEFAELPGGQRFLYDLPTRIRSTAKLLAFLIGQVNTVPFETDQTGHVFEAVGTAHARAELPLALVEEGPEVFGRCLAKVAAEQNHEWIPDYSAAWERLMRGGVEIQKQAYVTQRWRTLTAPTYPQPPSTGSEFRDAMRLMRGSNPQQQEDGFHQLRQHAAEHLDDLIEQFEQEQDRRLRCWLLELIGGTKSPEALPILSAQLNNPDKSLRDWAVWGLAKLDTSQARALLWQHWES